MTDTPTPRSYQQILSEMLDATLRRVPFEGFRIGGPLLSLLEAAAQSDVKSTQDIFSLLDSISVDRANGVGLDRIGIDEGLSRLAASPASGKVKVTDTSFSKIATVVFAGADDANAGSTSINVADASGFPATGSIYVGRGTTNYEGPLAYTSVLQVGNYWQVILSSPTVRFHNKNESVIVAQGGNRSISVGTSIKGNDTNSGTAVSFTVTDNNVILDGENVSADILVVAEKPGIAGNVGANSIVKFSSSPFTGATVTNALPFVNGTEIEDDATFRERIRNARKSKTKGTALAIKEAVLGLTATDEDARVASANVVIRKDAPAQLFIDNGLGYEPTSEPVAYEVIIDSALGGEKDFQLLGNRPIFKAFVRTINSAPFALVDGCVLSVKVGGLTYEHTFPAEDFKSVASATAYEIAASINANSDLPFTARTTSNSQQVALTSKEVENEDIEVSVPSAGTDANSFLNFPIGKVETLKLFKNGRALNKDGSLAVVVSAPQSDWNITIATGDYLTIDVDGTGNRTFSIQDADFINNNTGYSSVAATNSLESWVTVFNKKITGVTASVVGTTITFTSNKGESADASVVISAASTLVTKGMFIVGELSSTGSVSDYTLNRNLGQGQLAVALDAGDKLTAGTLSSNAFVETGAIGTSAIAAGNKFWLSVDGDAAVVETDVTSGTSIAVSLQAPTYNALVLSFARYTAFAGTFSNLLVGDYLILWDAAFTDKGIWRVSRVDAAGAYFEVARTTVTTQTASPSQLGMVFVRTAKPIQEITIAATNYNADALVTALNAALAGATAKTNNNDYVQIQTNSVNAYGDLLIPTLNTTASGYQFSGDLGPIENEPKAVACVETTSTDFDMPDFKHWYLTNVAGSVVDSNGASVFNSFAWLRPWESATVFRYGNNNGSRSLTSIFSPYTITLRSETFNTSLMNQDRYYEAVPFSTSSDDTLSVTVDGDNDFTIPMWRSIIPALTATYGTSFDVEDLDNGNNPLTTAFGSSFSFDDFAVLMRARVKTHGTSAANKGILWRYGRFGKDGEGCSIAYENPSAPSLPLGLEVWDATTARIPITNPAPPHIAITLPSGAARTGLNLFSNTRLSVAFTTALGIDTITYSAAAGAVAAPTLIAAAGTSITDNTTYFTVNCGVPHSLSAGDYVHLSGWAVTGYNGGWIVDSTVGLNSFKVTYAGGLGNDGVAASVYKVYTIRSATAPSTVRVKTTAAHNLSAGNYVWMTWSAADANFPNGAKMVASVISANEFTYAESGTLAGNAFSGTVGYSASSPDFTNVIVNDIVNISNGGNTGGIDDENCGVFRVTAKTATTFTIKRLAGEALTATALPILNTDYLKFYPLDTSATTATDIVTFIGANYRDIVFSAVVVEDGGGSPGIGTISKSSFDEYIDGAASFTHFFVDGYNQVSSLPLGAAPDTLTLKYPPNASLTTNADFVNEELKLVPITTNAIVRWLNSSAVTGLSSYVDIRNSYSDFKAQISHKNPGTSHTLQVNGGKANSASTSIIGTGNETGRFVTVDSDTVSGISGGAWVTLENQAPEIKQLFASGNSITLTSGGTNLLLLQATLATLWDVKWVCPNSVVWKFERHGRYACVAVPFPVSVSPNLAGASPAIKAGDYLKITSSSQNIADVNQGWFKVEKYDTTYHTIWFINDNLSEQQITIDTADDSLEIYDADMVIPGDTFTIPDESLGAANRGTWVVSGLGGTATSVYLQVSGGAANPITALGDNATSFCFNSGSNLKLVKKVVNVTQDVGTGNHKIYFSDTDRLAQFTDSKSATISVAHKFNFPTEAQTGLDAYAYGTGLIAECAKVVYGDERNPGMYPGIAAAGAEIDIEGPVIRKLSIAVSARIKTNLDIESVVTSIKSAIAFEINSTPIGTNIPISKIVSAIMRVDGTNSVVIVSPVYGTGNDIIEVKAFEKPLILDLDNDITVEVVGS